MKRRFELSSIYLWARGVPVIAQHPPDGGRISKIPSRVSATVTAIIRRADRDRLRF
jgi:hypothetical protein